MKLYGSVRAILRRRPQRRQAEFLTDEKSLNQADRTGRGLGVGAGRGVGVGLGVGVGVGPDWVVLRMVPMSPTTVPVLALVKATS